MLPPGPAPPETTEEETEDRATAEERDASSVVKKVISPGSVPTPTKGATEAEAPLQEGNTAATETNRPGEGTEEEVPPAQEASRRGSTTAGGGPVLRTLAPSTASTDTAEEGQTPDLADST